MIAVGFLFRKLLYNQLCTIYTHVHISQQPQCRTLQQYPRPQHPVFDVWFAFFHSAEATALLRTMQLIAYLEVVLEASDTGATSPLPGSSQGSRDTDTSTGTTALDHSLISSCSSVGGRPCPTAGNRNRRSPRTHLSSSLSNSPPDQQRFFGSGPPCLCLLNASLS